MLPPCLALKLIRFTSTGMATCGCHLKVQSETAVSGLTKAINEYRNGYINSFVYFCSASELLRASPIIWDYPVCIPFKRVKQLRATANGFEPVSPSTWNLLVYGPPVDQTLTDIDKVTLFYNTFQRCCRVIYNEYAGDSWSKDLEFFEENKGAI